MNKTCSVVLKTDSDVHAQDQQNRNLGRVKEVSDFPVGQWVKQWMKRSRLPQEKGIGTEESDYEDEEDIEKWIQNDY